MRGRRLGAVAAALTVAALVTSPAAAATAPESGTKGAPAGPCGLMTYQSSHRPTYQHVIMIMDENLSYQHFVASTQATYLDGLAAACGSETNMHAATHPSQANYMAATSGYATPTGIHSTNNNVFHELQAAGKTWKNYAESMPTSCARQSSAAPYYKIGHTPAFWYTDLTKPKNTCAQDDVPLSPGLDNAIANDKLPAYAWITPDTCNDMHWLAACPYPSTSRVAAGDTWLSTLIPRLTSMPSYHAGRTLIIVSAYVGVGSTDDVDHNLYSLLGTTEDVLGLARLGNAMDDPSMRAGLRF